MIIDWKILLLTYPIALSLLFGCYATGVLLSKIVNSNIKQENLSADSQSIFWKLVGGLMFIIGIYAIITTNFQTSLLPIPFLACALLRWESLAHAHQKKIISKKTFLSTLGFLCTAIFFYWMVYGLHFIIPMDDKISFISGDTLFYARAADFLNFSGIETVTIDYSSISDPVPEPYHYGDLWTIALVQKLTGLPSALIISTVVYPVLAAIFFLGLSNYIYSIDNEKKPFINYLLLLSFTSGFLFLFPSFLSSGSFSVSVPLVFTPKLFFAAIFFVGILLAHQQGSSNATITMASAGSLLFINIAPALLITAGGLGICWLSKGRKKKDLIIYTVYCILGILSLFYFILFNKYNSSVGLDPGRLSFNLHTFFNILTGGLIQFLPLLPFLLLFFLWPIEKSKRLHKRTIPKEIVIPILFLTSSLIAWGLLYTSTPEAVQFFSNTLIPVSSIIVSLLLFRAIISKQKKFIISAFLLIGLSILLNLRFMPGHSSVRKEDLSMVSKFVKNHQPGIFANIRASKEFHNYFVRNTMVIQPLPFITYLYPNYYNISLNTPSIPIDSTWPYAMYEKNVLAASPFSQYIKKKDTTYSLDEYAYNFLIEHKFRYLTVSPDTSLPQRLVPLVKDSIILSNNWHIYYIEK